MYDVANRRVNNSSLAPVCHFFLLLKKTGRSNAHYINKEGGAAQGRTAGVTV